MNHVYLFLFPKPFKALILSHIFKDLVTQADSVVLTLSPGDPLLETLLVRWDECNFWGDCGSLWTHPWRSGQAGASGARVPSSETLARGRHTGWCRRVRVGRRARAGRSGSCPLEAEIQTLWTAQKSIQTMFETRSSSLLSECELTFDPAHGVDNDGSLSALGASTPQGLKGFQVAV